MVLAELITELASLCAKRYPEPPPIVLIRKSQAAIVERAFGFHVPVEIQVLFCTSDVYSEPWNYVMFLRPEESRFKCESYQDWLNNHAPPLRVQAGVKARIIFGMQLLPFAYEDDSVYCMDMDPDLTTGGTPNQIVNVSLRKGIAKVVFPDLAAFLADGLKKMKREMKREHAAEARASSAPPVTAEQIADVGAMLVDPLAYLKKLHSNLPGGAAWPGAAPLPGAWNAAQRRQRADELIAANPQRSDVQRVCARLVNFYADHEEFDDALQQTALPMPRAKRTKVERTLGIAMPTDLCELLDAHQFVAAPWDNVAFIGVDEGMAKQCKQLNAIKVPFHGWALLPGTVAPTFGKGFLPLNADDPVICYDLKPGAGGRVGQIVEVSFESRSCKVVASSLLEFFAQGLDKLKNSGASVE